MCHVLINDLPSFVTSSILLFADDAIIFQELKKTNYAALHNDLDALYAWSTTW